MRFQKYRYTCRRVLYLSDAYNPCLFILSLSEEFGTVESVFTRGPDRSLGGPGFTHHLKRDTIEDKM